MNPAVLVEYVRLRKDLADQVGVVRFVFAGDLAGNNHSVIFDQTFHSYAAVAIMLKAIRHDGVCDLVADLIYVSA